MDQYLGLDGKVLAVHIYLDILDVMLNLRSLGALLISTTLHIKDRLVIEQNGLQFGPRSK